MVERSGYVDGEPCWADLVAPDLAAAQRFYSTLFGWTFLDTGPDFGHYVMCLKDGKAVAGMSPPMPGAEQTPAAWSLYLMSHDLEDTARRVDTGGGKVIVAPMDIPSNGRMLFALDPSGAAFGAWEPRPAHRLAAVRRGRRAVLGRGQHPRPGRRRHLLPGPVRLPADQGRGRRAVRLHGVEPRQRRPRRRAAHHDRGVGGHPAALDGLLRRRRHRPRRRPGPVGGRPGPARAVRLPARPHRGRRGPQRRRLHRHSSRCGTGVSVRTGAGRTSPAPW